MIRLNEILTDKDDRPIGDPPKIIKTEVVFQCAVIWVILGLYLGQCNNKISNISIMLLIITIISLAIDHKYQYKFISSL